METNDGGQTFPMGYHPEGNSADQQGMTLRDWFAGQAMVALHSSEQRGGRWDPGSAKICAKNAYELADAMLAARGGAK